MAGTDKVLIIDDDIMIQELLETCLAPLGYELSFASHGQEALELLKTRQFNLAILDIMLPGINGIEILRRVAGRIPETEIIVLTGYASLETAIEALRLGAYDYATKPFAVDGIRSTVRRAIEKQHLETRLSAIYDLSREMTLSLEVHQVAQAVLDIVERGLEIKICALWLVDEPGQELYPLAARGTGQDTPARLPLSNAHRTLTEAARTGTQLYIPDTREENRYVFEPACRSELAVPLTLQESVIGVLHVESVKMDAFSPNDQRLLSTLAAQAAVAIENARLHEQAQQEIADRTRAEEALEQERDLISALLNTVGALVVVLDSQGQIVRFNRACEQVTGYSFNEVHHKHVWDLFLVPEEVEPVKAVFDELRLGEFPNQYENYWVAKDGTRRLIAWSNTALLDDQGAVEYVIGTGLDISERVQAENKIIQRSEELAALNEIGQAITSSLDLHETLNLITAHTTRLLDVMATSLLLYDEDSDDLWFAAGSGEDVDMVLNKRLAMGQGIAGWVVQYGEPTLVPDVTQDPRWFSGFDEAGSFSTRSALCVPLQADGRTIGALEVMNKKSGAFDQEDLRLLSALAVPAATAIANARLFEQIRIGREQLQALSRRLVEVQESERRQLSRELHDETGQALSSLLLGLSLIEREANDPDAVISRATELESIADEMLENLHRMAMNLRPASLDYLGLEAALEQYAETFQQQHDLTVRLETVGIPEERLPSAVETALYRIVQEALTNVVRHAQATRVDVLLERRGDQIVVIIEDDGVGFDPEMAKQSGRLGLFGVQERAEMLGGALTIESSSELGTTVLVEVPYDHSDSDR